MNPTGGIIPADDDKVNALRGSAAWPAGATVLAIAFCLGVAIGWFQPAPCVWPWIALGAASLVATIVARRDKPAALISLNLAALALGAAWTSVRLNRISAENLIAWVDHEARLVEVGGVALSRPELRPRAAGSMANYDYRDPATYFLMRVDRLVSGSGESTPVTGKLYVRVDETVEPFRIGDALEAKGFLRRPTGPHNPGEFDYRRYARSLGQAGVLSVPGRDLLNVTKREAGDGRVFLARWRDAARRRAGRWLLTDLPGKNDRQRDALLKALLLGQRDRELAELDTSFRHVGLGHLLAISGLHLGVFIGFVLVAANWRGHLRRRHGWLIIALVLAYLFLVEVRAPVLRAGIMAIAASLGLACGRRWRIQSLVALSAVGLLIWRPDQLFNAGFQLSFAVVLGLIHFVPPVRRRWFGPANRVPATTFEMIAERGKDSCVVAVVAWVVATPITIYHFGMFSPLAPALTLVVLPLVALLLATGYLKMILCALLPSVALMLGGVLWGVTSLVITIVKAADALPGAVLHVPFPGATWAVSACAWACAGLMWVGRRRWKIWVLTGAGLTLWLLWPLVPIGARPALRVDMFAVGDGSCYLLRSAGETMVFDAGSGTDLDAARRTIIPAMRRLNVHSIDILSVSHPNIDHCSAVLELVDEFGVDRVFLTGQFLHAAEQKPRGAAAFLLRELANRHVNPAFRAAGDRLAFGSATVHWLHPEPGRVYEENNNSSMVIRIDTGRAVVLLTGDIQEQAIEELLGRHADLRAEVVELPHHGSYNDAAVDLIRHLDPRVVLQSTGARRWREDKWGDALSGTRRLVTPRDGACRVEIHHDGAIETGRFLP